LAIFAIADLHLSIGEDKPMDVFGGKWKNYHEKLAEYWTYMVTAQDTVVIPGDVSWAMSLEEAAVDFDFLHRLPGKKILMKGNHDYWWNTLTKMNRFLMEKDFHTLSFLYNNALLAEGKVLCGSRGWLCEDYMKDEDDKILVRENQRFVLSLQEAKKTADNQEALTGVRPEIIAFSHYPVFTQGYKKNPVIDTLISFGVKRVYCGHLHGVHPEKVLGGNSDLKQYLVASDYLEFTPMTVK
jgi:hypothetical protein